MWGHQLAEQVNIQHLKKKNRTGQNVQQFRLIEYTLLPVPISIVSPLYSFICIHTYMLCMFLPVLQVVYHVLCHDLSIIRFSLVEETF